jgi:hypothetical protein
MEGNQVSECLGNGQWSVEEPVCKTGINQYFIFENN